MAKQLRLGSENLEVNKIEMLNKEMAKVVKSKKQPLSQRLREYEELLADYRQSLENFRRNEPDHEFLEQVAEKVYELIQIKKAKVPVLNGRWNRL